jgi:hypothetical protein
MNNVTAKRFSIAEYHRLGELGFFAPDEPVELIRGDIINMAAKVRLHYKKIDFLWNRPESLLSENGARCEIQLRYCTILN